MSIALCWGGCTCVVYVCVCVVAKSFKFGREGKVSTTLAVGIWCNTQLWHAGVLVSFVAVYVTKQLGNTAAA